MITPAANTEMMNLHLEEISTQVAPGACAVMLCDQAGWHQQGPNLRLPKNIKLLPLPPYSPELNPMENVWDYLRQNKLCSTVWDSYDDIIEACKNAWNWLIDDPNRIRSIGTRDWATQVNVQGGWYQIGEKLSLMQRGERFDGLNLNNDGMLNDQIEAVSRIKRCAAIRDGLADLAVNRKTTVL